MHLGFVVGYEMALEKLGFYSEEALAIIKEAGGAKAVKDVVSKATSKATSKAAPAAAEAGKEVAKKPGASATEWFGRRKPWEQAALLGGSGLGTLGAGAALGRASKD